MMKIVEDYLSSQKNHHAVRKHPNHERGDERPEGSTRQRGDRFTGSYPW